MSPGKLELSASKSLKAGKGKAQSADRRCLILLGLVIVLAVVVSWVTRDTLSSEIPAGPTAAVMDTVPAQQPTASHHEPAAAPVVDGIM
jgi:hypothetical protein